MASFNSTAVGAGSIRTKYEKRLQNFIKKAFEVLIISAPFFPVIFRRRGPYETCIVGESLISPLK